MLVIDRAVENLPLELEVGVAVVRGVRPVDDGLGGWQVHRLRNRLNNGLRGSVDSLSYNNEMNIP